VEEKGRFEPVSVNKWINEKTILSEPYPKEPDDTGAGVELGISNVLRPVDRRGW
jgi:hypothetical protein